MFCEKTMNEKLEITKLITLYIYKMRIVLLHAWSYNQILQN